jgi:hypothetical protein
MHDSLLPTPVPSRADPTAAALARAAAAIARLDQALAGHPLLPAVLYRARLEAARHAAAVDGHGIDPWHLAAVLEGLRLRIDPYLSMRDRGAIFDAARHAFDQYQWLVTPDFDQEGEIQAAEKCWPPRPAPRRCSPPPMACTPGSVATATAAAAIAAPAAPRWSASGNGKNCSARRIR